MRKIIFLLLISNYSLQILNAQSQFQRTIGGAGSDTAYFIIQTTDGGYAVAGVTNSFGAGGIDAYIVKLDGSGILQWSRTVGGSGNDFAFSIVQTAEGGYAVAGESNSFGAGNYDFYIVKLSDIGNLQWSRTVGGTNYDFAWSIIQTPDAGYALAGSTNSFGVGSDDIYIVKLDNNGMFQWCRTIGGTNRDNAYYSIIRTTDNGYAVAGRSNSFGAGYFDMYIVKLDSFGTLQWNKSLGGANDEHVSAIIQTQDGGYALAGGTTSFGAGDYDFYVSKFDASGAIQWSRTIGGTLSERAYSIIQTLDYGYVIVGWTNSFGAGGYDMYIVKLSPAGTLQWSRTTGGTGNDYARSIVQKSDGGFTVAGITNSFGLGEYDFYIVKLDAGGNTCGNTSTPSSISGSGGILGSPSSTVTIPTSTVTIPGSLANTGGNLNTICVIGIKHITNEIPRLFELYHNYPNPFNPNTILRFDIAKSTYVSLTIYDVLGQQVATIVNEKLEPGTYEAEFDGTNYPSGVYFYKFVTEYYSNTKRMVLVK